MVEHPVRPGGGCQRTEQHPQAECPNFELDDEDRQLARRIKLSQPGRQYNCPDCGEIRREQNHTYCWNCQRPYPRNKRGKVEMVNG